MATESEQPEIPDELSPEEAQQYPIWFLGRQDLDEHEEVCDELVIE